MSLYVIGDTHLSFSVPKEMDIFGGNWVGYMDKLSATLSQLQKEDTLLLCGDISWGMSLEQSLADFQFLARIPARVILLKGNHDYWWTSLKKMKEFFAANSIENIDFLHNNCQFYGDVALCGTRGWFYEEERGNHSAKVFKRELMRLETSLQMAGEKEKICFLHYPPLTKGYCCREIVDLLKKYDVKHCYFGHLHGKQHQIVLQGEREGVEYHLIAADYLNCVPAKIM